MDQRGELKVSGDLFQRTPAGSQFQHQGRNREKTTEHHITHTHTHTHNITLQPDNCIRSQDTRCTTDHNAPVSVSLSSSFRASSVWHTHIHTHTHTHTHIHTHTHRHTDT